MIPVNIRVLYYLCLNNRIRMINDTEANREYNSIPLLPGFIAEDSANHMKEDLKHCINHEVNIILGKQV